MLTHTMLTHTILTPRRAFPTFEKPQVTLQSLSSAVLAGAALALTFTLFNARPGLAQSPPLTTPADTQSTGVQPAEASKAATQTAYSLGTQTHTQAGSRIVLNLSERRVYLYRGAMLVSSYPVAVGTAATPTPRGEFTISKMVVDPVWQSPWTGEITPPGPNSALGLRWLEFTTSEAGAFGFHGTPTIDSIGHAASNGCVRMRNEDVVALFSQVSVGTPVIIQ